VKLLAVAAVLLAASPALAESPSGAASRPRLELERSNQASVVRTRANRAALGSELRAARQIRTSLDGSERAALGADAGVRRFIRLSLDDEKSVATFPPLDAFAAREVLEAESSGPVRAGERKAARPHRTNLPEERAPVDAARPIRVDLSADRVALSTPLPARRFRTTLD
jgi:hypothetical protein